MPDHLGPDEWSSTAWRSMVQSWIDEVLPRHQLRRTGPTEQPRIRPWSTQLTVPTDRGRLWFKENTASMRYEAGLVELLGQIVPERVVVPLAVDPSRGWMLSPDAGPTLAEQPEQPEAVWTQIVQQYAVLQRTLVEHAAHLTAVGAPRLSPTEAVEWVRTYAEGLADLPSSDPRAISAEDLGEILTFVAQVSSDAEVLADGVPLSLDHNDLHANNVFLPEPDGTLRFFDFGDALVAHPFSSLRVALDAVGEQWGGGSQEPVVRRVADAYLEVWSDLVAGRELRRMVDPARRLGVVNRAHSWHSVLSSTPQRHWGDFGGAGGAWLLMAARMDRQSDTIYRAAT